MDPGIGDDDDDDEEYDELYTGIYLPPKVVQFSDQKTGLPAAGAPVAHNQMKKPEKIVGEPIPSLNPYRDSSKYLMEPTSRVNVINSNDMSAVDGNRKLIVGELHYWTTDADIEMVIYQYGKVKEIKFFEERDSGKSKGYCQVEFYDPAAAAACKEGLHGHVFNGRPCVVAFSTPQIINQMEASYTNKINQNLQAQPQLPYDGGAAGRGNWGRSSYGRGGGRGRGPNKGPGPGPIRGRGGMGMGNAPAGAGGQGHGFGRPPGMMHPQGMMGGPGFMGGGGGYGGFSGPSFPGMLPPYPPAAVNPMGLPAGVAHHADPAFFGVAPSHATPAFFGHGMAPNVMDNSAGGWRGEEHGRGTSYGGDDNASEYGYGEATTQEKLAAGVRSTSASREKERNSEPEKRHRQERDHDRDYKQYREEKDRYHRHKDRHGDHDWDRGQSSRSHHRSRSRDADYRKQRR